VSLKLGPVGEVNNFASYSWICLLDQRNKSEQSPIIAGAPSVQTPTKLAQLKMFVSKKSATTWTTSTSLEVVPKGRQKKSSMTLALDTANVYEQL